MSEARRIEGRARPRGLTAAALAVLLAACAASAGVAAQSAPADEPVAEAAAPAETPPTARTVKKPAYGKGGASWYGRKFHGRRTASGERYDMHALTAAHRTLPFGTRVRVRSLATGKEVVVRINDRGPFRRSRIIDLSQAAVAALGLRHRGVTTVELLPE